MKFIKLTRVLADVNQKGKRKMEEQIRNQLQPPTSGNGRDEYGRTAEWYREMGMAIPEGLEDEQPKIDFAGHIDVDLDENDYDYSYFDVLCNMEYVESIESTETFTLIGFNSGEEISVVETVEQIEKILINK